jgi:hypothetical protein
VSIIELLLIKMNSWGLILVLISCVLQSCNTYHKISFSCSQEAIRIQVFWNMALLLLEWFPLFQRIIVPSKCWELLTQCHIPEYPSLQKKTVRPSGIAGRRNTFIEHYLNKTFSFTIKKSLNLLLKIKKINGHPCFK